MSNIHILSENVTNGFNIVSLDIITLISILCAVFVIVSKNPIVSVLFLIGLFLTIAVYLMLLGMNFIGLSYLLVYVGAVSILFLFILMLINIRISEIVSTTSNSIPLGIIIGSLFFFNISKALPKDNNINIISNKNLNNIQEFTIEKQQYGLNEVFANISNEFNIFISKFSSLFNSLDDTKYSLYNNITNNSNTIKLSDNTFEKLHLTYSHNWDSMLAEVSHINILGNILYTSFPLWILLTSIILLLAMVGAIVITLKN